MKPATLLLLLFLGCEGIIQAQSRLYKLSIQINDGISEGKAFLRYFTDRGPRLDSAALVNGKTILTGRLPDKPIIAKIYLHNSKGGYAGDYNVCEVWLENAEPVTITAVKELANARYSGTPMQEQFSELQASLLALTKKRIELDNAYTTAEQKKDAAGKDKLLNEEYPAWAAEQQKVLGHFIKKYPSSLISALKFQEFAGDGVMDVSIVEPVYNSLSEQIRKHPSVEKAATLISINKRLAPGKEAIDFSQTDTSGNTLSLSAFRNKYILIDFWAGWCVPCRAENPHLKTLYRRYKTSGFEILGVSLDGERKRWTDAIVADGLPWPQVSDLNIFDNRVAKLYGITSIPQNILIDPDGKIVARNLRGSALEKKLETIF